MSPELRIRIAEAAEYAEIGELTVRGYAADGFVTSSDGYADQLRDARSRARDGELWVAVETSSERLLGCVTFCPPGSPYRELAGEGEGEFRMLAVDPDARGRGVGGALTSHCLERSRELGFSSVVICSLPEMTAAHRLYAALGFVRDRALDWSPVAGVELWGFRRTLAQPASERMAAHTDAGGCR